MTQTSTIKEVSDTALYTLLEEVQSNIYAARAKISVERALLGNAEEKRSALRDEVARRDSNKAKVQICLSRPECLVCGVDVEEGDSECYECQMTAAELNEMYPEGS